MPEAHRGHARWTPESLLDIGRKIGPYAGRTVEALLNRKAHPEQAYRAVLGLIALQKRYGRERLEKACHIAWHYRTSVRRFIENLLRHHRENQQITRTPPPVSVEHENLRVPDYYH